MNIFKAIDEAVKTLSDPRIDETRYYDNYPARGNTPASDSLNIHGLRLLANYADISIIEVVELKQPKYDDKGKMLPSEYVVSATAEIITDANDTRRDTSIVSQPTHYNAGKENPNFRETAVTRAKRNAIKSLVPERYYLDKMIGITEDKKTAEEQLANAEENTKKLARSRFSAYMELTYKENAEALWKTTRESVIEEYGEESEWGVDGWSKIVSAFDEALAEGADVDEEQIAEDENTTEQAAEQHVETEFDF